MRPLVTLVTPVYNAMPHFRTYLECVAAQTWRPLEFLCVDDGSDDGSSELLGEATPALESAGIRVRRLRREHGGQAAAVNAALALVEGEFFTWCDADDWMTPDSIEKKALYLIAHPDVGMVRSDGTVLDADAGRVVSRSAREQDRARRDIFDDLFHDRTYCYAGCYMLRSALLFACYGERRIPLSPEGQNLQLLLPPASRSECGFLPEPLHTYCRRGDGHSSADRSFVETLKRLENFTKLKLEILEYCDCDREYYTEAARRIEAARRLVLCRAAAAWAREDIGR